MPILDSLAIHLLFAVNKHQRAKALALTGCRVVRYSWDDKFIRAMAWLAEHDSAAVLTPKQRFSIDALLWRYRRQLAGREDIEIPTEPPREEDYEPAPRKKRQLSLL